LTLQFEDSNINVLQVLIHFLSPGVSEFVLKDCKVPSQSQLHELGSYIARCPNLTSVSAWEIAVGGEFEFCPERHEILCQLPVFLEVHKLDSRVASFFLHLLNDALTEVAIGECNTAEENEEQVLPVYPVCDNSRRGNRRLKLCFERTKLGALNDMIRKFKNLVNDISVTDSQMDNDGDVTRLIFELSQCPLLEGVQIRAVMEECACQELEASIRGALPQTPGVSVVARDSQSSDFSGVDDDDLAAFIESLLI